MSQSNPDVPIGPALSKDEILQRRDITTKEYHKQAALSTNVTITVQILGVLTVILSFFPTPVHPYMLAVFVLMLITLMVQLVLGRNVCSVAKFNPSRYATKSFVLPRTKAFRNMTTKDLNEHHLSLVENPTNLKYDPIDRSHTLSVEMATTKSMFNALANLTMLVLASLFVYSAMGRGSTGPLICITVILFAILLTLAVHEDNIVPENTKISHADDRIHLTHAFKELIASDKAFEAAIDKRKEKKQQNGQSE